MPYICIRRNTSEHHKHQQPAPADTEQRAADSRVSCNYESQQPPTQLVQCCIARGEMVGTPSQASLALAHAMYIMYPKYPMYLAWASHSWGGGCSVVCTGSGASWIQTLPPQGHPLQRPATARRRLEKSAPSHHLAPSSRKLLVRDACASLWLAPDMYTPLPVLSPNVLKPLQLQAAICPLPVLVMKRQLQQQTLSDSLSPQHSCALLIQQKQSNNTPKCPAHTDAHGNGSVPPPPPPFLSSPAPFHSTPLHCGSPPTCLLVTRPSAGFA